MRHIFFILIGCLLGLWSAPAQTVLGKHPSDQFVPGFFNQNSNVQLLANALNAGPVPITNVPPTAATIPPGVLTNNARNVTLAGAFTGDGAGLTNANLQTLFNSASGPLPTGLLTAGPTNGQGHLLIVSNGKRYTTTDGGALSNLQATAISGVLPLAVLPAAVLTNNAVAATVTNLKAGNLSPVAPGVLNINLGAGGITGSSAVFGFVSGNGSQLTGITADQIGAAPNTVTNAALGSAAYANTGTMKVFAATNADFAAVATNAPDGNAISSLVQATNAAAAKAQQATNGLAGGAFAPAVSTNGFIALAQATNAANAVYSNNPASYQTAANVSALIAATNPVTVFTNSGPSYSFGRTNVISTPAVTLPAGIVTNNPAGLNAIYLSTLIQPGGIVSLNDSLGGWFTTNPPATFGVTPINGAIKCGGTTNLNSSGMGLFTNGMSLMFTENASRLNNASWLMRETNYIAKTTGWNVPLDNALGVSGGTFMIYGNSDMSGSEFEGYQTFAANNGGFYNASGSNLVVAPMGMTNRIAFWGTNNFGTTNDLGILMNGVYYANPVPGKDYSTNIFFPGTLNDNGLIWIYGVPGTSISVRNYPGLYISGPGPTPRNSYPPLYQNTPDNNPLIYLTNISPSVTGLRKSLLLPGSQNDRFFIYTHRGTNGAPSYATNTLVFVLQRQMLTLISIGRNLGFSGIHGSSIPLAPNSGTNDFAMLNAAYSALATNFDSYYDWNGSNAPYRSDSSYYVDGVHATMQLAEIQATNHAKAYAVPQSFNFPGGQPVVGQVIFQNWVANQIYTNSSTRLWLVDSDESVTPPAQTAGSLTGFIFLVDPAGGTAWTTNHNGVVTGVASTVAMPVYQELIGPVLPGWTFCFTNKTTGGSASLVNGHYFQQ